MSETQIVPCPYCGAQYPLTTDYLAQYAGQQSQCRQCGQPFTIPQPSSIGAPLPLPAAAIPVLPYRTAALAAQGTGVWSDGPKVIVATDGATFPPRCVKCNAPPSGAAKKRRIYWHHPAVYIAVISPLIYVILALVLRKSGKIEVFLCQAHKNRRVAFIIGGWLSVPAAIVCFVLAGNTNVPELFVPLGIIIFLGGIITGVVGSRIVIPSRIENGYLWLKGAGREFIASLPTSRI